MDAEYDNIAALVRICAGSGRHESAWQLACLLQPYLRIVNYGPGAQELFALARDSADAIGDDRGVGLALLAAAKAAFAREQVDETRSLTHAAMDASRRAGDRLAILYQQIQLALLHIDAMDYGEARAVLTACRKLAVELDDCEARSAVTNNLGFVHSSLGEDLLALECFEAALAENDLSGQRQSEATIWANLGYVHTRLGAAQVAEDAFERALELSRTPSFPFAEVYALLGRALLRRSAGRTGASMAICRTARALAGEAGLHHMESQALVYLGDAMLVTGEREAAATAYQEAAVIISRHNLAECRGWPLDGLAHVAAASGDVSTAMRLWRHALDAYPAEQVEAREIQRHLAAAAAGEACEACDRCSEPLGSPGQ